MTTDLAKSPLDLAEARESVQTLCPLVLARLRALPATYKFFVRLRVAKVNGVEGVPQRARWQFDVETIVVSRVATHANFEARMENASGNRTDSVAPFSHALPSGALAWGAPATPALIPGGVFVPVGGYLGVEVETASALELGLWCIEIFGPSITA